MTDLAHRFKFFGQLGSFLNSKAHFSNITPTFGNIHLDIPLASQFVIVRLPIFAVFLGQTNGGRDGTGRVRAWAAIGGRYHGFVIGDAAIQNHISHSSLENKDIRIVYVLGQG